MTFNPPNRGAGGVSASEPQRSRDWDEDDDKDAPRLTRDEVEAFRAQQSRQMPVERVRPESSNRYFPWLIAGLFFWPLLICAAVVYSNDRNKYQRAMLEYSEGGNPRWYWDSWEKNGASSNPWKPILIILGVMAAILVFVIFVVISLSGGGQSTIEDLGGQSTIEDLGGG